MRYLRIALYIGILLLAAVVGVQITELSFKPHFAYDPISKQCLLPQIRLVHSSLPQIQTSTPIPKRDVSARFYLQCSVRIHVGRVSGSGTICSYNNATNEAYVISCGHLFEGTESPGQSKINNAKIHVFYKNDTKLPEFQAFDSEVVCHDAEEDISILKFHPDWVPQHCFPIAPTNYPIQAGCFFESVGCDHAEETAAYTVEIVEGMDTGRNLVTKNNSPRPGRSGGGLLSEDGYFVGIVWGTSKLDGTGYGYNVPLRRIHQYLGQLEQTKWLLSSGRQLDRAYELIPILDKNGSWYKVPQGYFPTPIVSPPLASPKSGQ